MTRNRFFSLDVGWQALLKDFGMRPEHVKVDEALAGGEFHDLNHVEGEVEGVVARLPSEEERGGDQDQ